MRQTHPAHQAQSEILADVVISIFSSQRFKPFLFPVNETNLGYIVITSNTQIPLNKAYSQSIKALTPCISRRKS